MQAKIGKNVFFLILLVILLALLAWQVFGHFHHSAVHERANGQAAGTSSTQNSQQVNTPAPSSIAMKHYSYPNLDFQVDFPTSWVVHDKSGPLHGEFTVEGRANSGVPGEFDESRPKLSKDEQLAADVAFLKGVRVTVYVREIAHQPMGLSEGVNNRIQGLRYTEGENVDILPLEQTQFAGVKAYVTKYTETYQKGTFGVITTSTVDYDFDHNVLRYVISIASPAEEFSKREQEFKDILQSFQLANNPSSAAAASAPDITGTWSGTSPGPCRDNPTAICDDGYLHVFSFNQSGDVLFGTSTGISRYLAEKHYPLSTVELEDGEVHGNTVSFVWQAKGTSQRCSSQGIINMSENEITLSDRCGDYTPEANAKPYRVNRMP